MLSGPSTNSFVRDTYSRLRLMGYGTENAKLGAAIRAAASYPCTIAEARAKLDYELSRSNLLSVLGDLL